MEEADPTASTLCQSDLYFLFTVFNFQTCGWIEVSSLAFVTTILGKPPMTLTQGLLYLIFNQIFISLKIMITFDLVFQSRVISVEFAFYAV